MDNASRSVADVELEGYYVAALAFIDPELPVDAPLDAIEAAALRREQSLASLPAPVAEADHMQLSEALDFLRRSYNRVPHEPVATEAVTHVQPETVIEPEAVLPQNAEAVFEVSPLTTNHSASNGNGHANGNGHSSGNGHNVLTDATPDSPLPVSPAEPTAPRRRSPLSKLWEDPECAETGDCGLPEARALPLAAGLGLLAYEAWLALFAGWVATRFMVWPRPGLGYEVSYLYGNVIVLVGLATAAVSAWLIWRYRATTRRLAGLVHAGAVLILFDLLRWKTEADPNVPPVIDPPGLGLWQALIIGWIVAGVYAHLSDLRAR